MSQEDVENRKNAKSESSTSSQPKKLRPWEKAWVNPKFVFKNPRCLKSKIPAHPTCAYDDAMNNPPSSPTQEEEEEDHPIIERSAAKPVEEVSMPRPKSKPVKNNKPKSRDTLKEWKQRRRKFVEKKDPQKGLFPTRTGFPYSDLPLEPEREVERVIPDWPAGMTPAEKRHWEAWAHKS